MGDDSEYVKYLEATLFKGMEQCISFQRWHPAASFSSIISRMDGLPGNHSEHFGLVVKNDYKLFRRRR